MTPTMKTLGIDRLSVAERIDLALQIWESIPPDLPVPPLTAERREELRRREAELDANPEIALTWEQIKESVQSRL